MGVAIFSWQSGPAIGSSLPSVPAPVAQQVQVNTLPSLAVFIDQGEIADALMRAIGRSGRFRIVERPQIEKILSKLQLSATSVVDPATAQRVGHLVGAQYLIFGGSQVFGGQVRVSARLVRTETGEIVASDFITGEASAALKLTDQLGGGLLSHFK